MCGISEYPQTIVDLVNPMESFSLLCHDVQVSSSDTELVASSCKNTPASTYEEADESSAGS